jgi:CubicO group peptidase (beta-lactamase class C family)
MLRHKLDAEFGDRRAWLLAFVSLGLDRLRGPALPVPAATLGVIGVVLLALGVVVAVAWSKRQPAEPELAPPAVDVAGDPVWSSAGSGEPPRPVPGAQEPAAVAAAVDRYLAPLAAMDAFAGSVLLARGGQILVHKAYGLADRASAVGNTTDTRFKLMSTSKSVTAVAVMRLVQAGKVDLDERVGKYVSPWPEAWRDVTVHDLLDHTSGIPNLEVEWGIVERRDRQRGLAVWPAVVKEFGLPSRPRSAVAFAYSNFNFELLGLVAESAVGKPFAEVLAQHVFAPAGMAATAIDVGTRLPSLAIGYFLGDAEPKPSEQDMSTIQAAGGLWSTTGDLYRFDRALKDAKLLSADVHARMVAPREASPHYACGWQVTPVHGRKCWHHSGGAERLRRRLPALPRRRRVCRRVEQPRVRADLSHQRGSRRDPVRPRARRAGRVDRSATRRMHGGVHNGQQAGALPARAPQRQTAVRVRNVSRDRALRRHAADPDRARALPRAVGAPVSTRSSRGGCGLRPRLGAHRAPGRAVARPGRSAADGGCDGWHSAAGRRRWSVHVAHARPLARVHRRDPARRRRRFDDVHGGVRHARAPRGLDAALDPQRRLGAAADAGEVVERACLVSASPLAAHKNRRCCRNRASMPWSPAISRGFRPPQIWCSRSAMTRRPTEVGASGLIAMSGSWPRRCCITESSSGISPR